MVARTQVIRFNPDRAPNPKKIRVGYEGDHIVERLEFVLPTVNANQTGFLMKTGENADIAMLTKGENGRYYVDLTAGVIGAEGTVDCYVRIDGADGETWQSGILKMIVGDVPDVEIEVEREYPTAVGQMLGAIAEHDAQMEAHDQTIAEYAIQAEAAKEAAQNSEAAAEEYKNSAETGAAAAERFAQRAVQYAANASAAANQAAASEEAAAVSADRAELAAATQGYVFFEINDAGELVMTKTANVEELDFRLNDSGELEVIYG